MKKIIKFFASIALASSFFFGCSNEINDTKAILSSGSISPELSSSSRAASTVSITLHLMYTPEDYTSWNIWAWKKDTAETHYNTGSAWPGTTSLEDDSETNFYKITFSEVDPTVDLAFIFVTSDGNTKAYAQDIIIEKEKLIDGANYYYVYGFSDRYTSMAECSGLKSGAITSADGKKIKLSVFGKKSATKNDYTVKDSNDSTLTIDSITTTETSTEITLASGDISKRPYKVSITGQAEPVTVNITPSLIDDLNIKYTGDDLGVTVSGSTATFKVWAPSASKVELLVYADVTKIGSFKATTVAAVAKGGTDEVELLGTPAATVDMDFDASTGVWSIANYNFGSNQYYKYRITNNGSVRYVCDINAKVCSPDSIAAKIKNIGDITNPEASYVNPFGSSGSVVKRYEDAVIYEMHIRDWSRAVVTDSLGKFDDVANDTIMTHLQDLGVTHVQLLPIFDYAQVCADENYNWGYNPYHYNVPEGRYVNYTDNNGENAVTQLRALVKKFHDAGIAVIMDVVYNHTDATEAGSLYDSTVPGYFYRQNSSGVYINGSGCGNELATNHYMVKKYVIDSLKHWMKDYHINGFRFDLMGCLESSTMKEIYEALYAIDKNVLVYGEPWTGGTSGVVLGATGAAKTTTGYGFGAFDDDYRDAIKGAEFGGFGLGEVQGSFNKDGIANGLKGLSGKNDRNTTGIPGLALHYAECHDNYTLFDKLVYSNLSNLSGDFASKFAPEYNSVMNDSTKLNLIKAKDKLAAAFVILGQGTPFINGGQEFLRTKKGNPDSYAPDTKGGIKWTTRFSKGTDTKNYEGTYTAETDIDDVNTVNLSMKTTYADVYNTYKGLIALRKSSKAFTESSTTNVVNLKNGINSYTVENGSEKYTVYFNATDNDYYTDELNASGYLGAGIKNISVSYKPIDNGKLVDISNGAVSVAANATDLINVPAHSFIVLKK